MFVTDGQVFTGTGDYGERSATILAAGGTAKLQKQHGDSGTDWIDVTNGTFAYDKEISFRAPYGQNFRWTITGAATVWLSPGFKLVS